MRFQNLIWDFDGTLFDTYPPLNLATRKAVAEFGGDESEARVAALLSDTLADTINILANELDLESETFKERVYHYWAQATIQDSPPFPGAIRVCERFTAAGGHNFIYTHRGRESLRAFLTGYEVGDLFAGIVARDDGFPRKPDPAGFLAVMARFDLVPDETLAVGDRDLDIIAAQAAGLRACLFDAEPGEGVRPDYVIADLAELESIIGI